MKYLDITYPDINNGLGCRVTLWVSGCAHHCEGCHNPEGWDYNAGKNYTQETCDEIVRLLSLPYISGLTISGGDPLSRSDDALQEMFSVIAAIRAYMPADKNIWIYAGDTYEEAMRNPYKAHILSICDVMVDGQYMQPLRDITLPFRGSTNQRILDLKKSRKCGHAVPLEMKKEHT